MPAGQILMRPIWVTDLTIMAGRAAAILFDLIVQGMVISLLFSANTFVTVTVFTLPLCCITARRVFVPAPEEGAEIAPAEDRLAVSAGWDACSPASRWRMKSLGG